MNFDELVEAVKIKVKSADAEIISLIPSLINEAVAQIAEEVDLPTLVKYSAVTTVLDQAWVNMPARFSGKLLYVGTSTGEVNIIDGGFNALLAKYPALDEVDSVIDVALLGNVLYYQGIPSDATVLSLIYMEEPAELTNSTDIPSDIPLLTHRSTIVPLAASMAYDLIESGDKADKVGMNSCLVEYDMGLTALKTWAHKRKSHIGRSVMQ